MMRAQLSMHADRHSGGRDEQQEKNFQRPRKAAHNKAPQRARGKGLGLAQAPGSNTKTSGGLTFS